MIVLYQSVQHSVAAGSVVRMEGTEYSHYLVVLAAGQVLSNAD